MDPVLAPFFVFAIACLIRKSRFLQFIGKLSTLIWFVHSGIINYYLDLLQGISISILRYSFLLFVSVIISMGLMKVEKMLEKWLLNGYPVI